MRVPFYLCLAAAGFVSFANQAAAAISVFNASGSFADGASLTGTITVDTTAGDVTAAALDVSRSLSPTLLTYSDISFQGAHPTNSSYELMLTESVPNNIALTLFIIGTGIDPTSLVGYAGGDFKSTTVGPGASSYDLIVAEVPQHVLLTSGSLTPVGAVPEPATIIVWSLLVAIAVGFGCLRRNRMA